MAHKTPARVLLINALGVCGKNLTYFALFTALTDQVKIHWPKHRNPTAAAEAILARPFRDYEKEMTIIDLITLASR